MKAPQIEIPSYIPYHVQYEETVLSVAASIIFKELELMKCPRVNLSQIIEKPQYGFTAAASRETGGIKLVRITDIQAGKIDWESVPNCTCDHPEAYYLEENDILFARTGGTTGKSFIVKGGIPKSVFASYLIRVRAKKETDPDFLYWFFKTQQYWSQVKQEKIGSAQPNVNGKKLASLEICLPEISIQKAVASYLGAFRSRLYSESMEYLEVPEIFNNAIKNIAKTERILSRVREARLLSIQAVEEEAALINAAKLQVFRKALENGCKVMKLDEVAPLNMGQSPPGKSYNKLGEGVPLLNGPTEFGEKYPKAVQWTTAPSKLCRPGDILICVRGATTGRMNWADREYCIGRGLAALAPRKEICNVEYLYYFIETQTQQMLALAAGSTFPNLPGAKLKKMAVPVPSLVEQHNIVEYLGSLEKHIHELGKLRLEIEREIGALIPSVLDRAFKGEL